MDAHRVELEAIGEDRGEEMLPGVLLHVIEAARPVDDPAHQLQVARRWRREHVRDAIALVDDVGHGDAAQRAGVERLSAGGG